MDSQTPKEVSSDSAPQPARLDTLHHVDERVSNQPSGLGSISSPLINSNSDSRPAQFSATGTNMKDSHVTSEQTGSKRDSKHTGKGGNGKKLRSRKSKAPKFYLSTSLMATSQPMSFTLPIRPRHPGDNPVRLDATAPSFVPSSLSPAGDFEEPTSPPGRGSVTSQPPSDAVLSLRASSKTNKAPQSYPKPQGSKSSSKPQRTDRSETQLNAPAKFQHISKAQAKKVFEKSLSKMPKPTENYLHQASLEPCQLSKRQRLLLVLDLNGTLLERKRATKTCWLRPQLNVFIRYCLDNHSVMVWSSAKPPNVDLMCSKIFTGEDRSKVLKEWGRDRLGLSEKEYWTKVQCYKRLETVWNDEGVQSLHPQSTSGGHWDQSNTVLIDDSALKASAQPYNHIEIPEFIRSSGVNEDEAKILVHVMSYLEDARWWDDVSKFMKKTRFSIAPPLATGDITGKI